MKVLAALVLGVSVAMAAPPASAVSADDRQRIAIELRTIGVRADVSELSDEQIIHIRQIMHSNRSHSDKRLLIKSAIGGRNSLFETLFGN